MKEIFERWFWPDKFVRRVLRSLLIVPIAMLIWPRVIPFQILELWRVHGSPVSWLTATLPLFAWGVGTTALIIFHKRKSPMQMPFFPEDILREGAVISAAAGIAEEITFRWLFFFESIILLKAANFLFFGFLGFGILEWVHLHVLGPVANFTTFHFLENFVFHSSGWAVGAGMLASNASFRNGHGHLGSLALMNSWCLGMYLFWITFAFGLPIAILAHFLYDFLIYGVVYCYVLHRRPHDAW